MAIDMSRYAGTRFVKTHPNNVHTHGSLEPVMSILDVRGFALHDLFLIGFNDTCGSILLPTESRAQNAAAALEPAFATKVYVMGQHNDEVLWATDYTRRALDGTTLSGVFANLTLTDGRQVIKDGRWVR